MCGRSAFWALWRVRFGRGYWTRTVRGGHCGRPTGSEGAFGLRHHGVGNGVAFRRRPGGCLRRRAVQQAVRGVGRLYRPGDDYRFRAVLLRRGGVDALADGRHGRGAARGALRSASRTAAKRFRAGRSWRGPWQGMARLPVFAWRPALGVARELRALGRGFLARAPVRLPLGMERASRKPRSVSRALLFRFEEARGRRRRFRGLAQGGATRKDRRGREQGRASGHRRARRFGRCPRPAVRRRCIGT